MYLVIDIETVSHQEDFSLLNDDWKQLWEEKVKWNLPKDTTAGEYYPQRAGIMAEFGKVVCISLILNFFNAATISKDCIL